MNFKPNEFFIGLVEFITIMLPGAVLAFIILLVEANHPIQPGHAVYQYVFANDTKIIFSIAFIFSSFGLGYFLSSVASGLDPLYDAIRKQIYPYEENLNEWFKKTNPSEKHQKDYLKIYEQYLTEKRKKEYTTEDIVAGLTEKEKSLEGFKIKFQNNFFRKILGLFFELEYKIKIDKGYEEARKILDTQPEAVRNATNAYKWASTVLEANYPRISEQATRIMAASKFFRSIVVVTFIFLLLQLLGNVSCFFWQINLIILVLSFREYIVQRQKSVQKTYQSIVILTYFKTENTEID